MIILLLLFLLEGVQSFDLYFVRHGARSPLTVPMRDVFGVGLQTLTQPGKTQAYIYGKQLHHRHGHIPSSSLQIYSTDVPRTRATAEYFLKGWFGIHQQGDTPFNVNPAYLPPCNLSFRPKKQSHHVNQRQYQNLIGDIPHFKDKTNREYQKYKVNDAKNRFVVNQKARANTKLCRKFQEAVPGSCRTQSVDQFMNFVDIMNCLDYINKTVPGVTRSEMQFPLDILNHDYNLSFQKQSFPNHAVQQDFSLLQQLYNLKPSHVTIVFTHDTQLLYLLRSLLGIQGIFKMLKGNMILPFLTSIHFNIQNGRARIFFNDVEFRIKGCEQMCQAETLFKIMNR